MLRSQLPRIVGRTQTAETAHSAQQYMQLDTLSSALLLTISKDSTALGLEGCASSELIAYACLKTLHMLIALQWFLALMPWNPEKRSHLGFWCIERVYIAALNPGHGVYLYVDDCCSLLAESNPAGCC